MLLSLLLLASLTSQISYSVFNNAGIMIAKSSCFTVDILHNTGTIEGSESVYLECEKLTGSGLIKGPKIEIIATECTYEGEINCDEECVVTTNTDPSELKFRFTGNGRLVVKSIEQLKS